MTTANIQLIKLYDDGDGAVHLSISVTTELYKTSLDDYTSMDCFKVFGQKLLNFPKNSTEPALEWGDWDSERNLNCLLLRAYLYDTLGHAGLEVKMRRNGKPIIAAQTHFSIATEVASINAFGKALTEWVESGGTAFSFDFYTGLH